MSVTPESQPAKEIKFCVNCLHFESFSLIETPEIELHSRCRASAEAVVNIVSGNMQKRMLPCHIMRSKDQPCGPDGKLYMPKVCGSV